MAKKVTASETNIFDVMMLQSTCSLDANRITKNFLVSKVFYFDFAISFKMSSAAWQVSIKKELGKHKKWFFSNDDDATWNEDTFAPFNFEGFRWNKSAQFCKLYFLHFPFNA